MHVCAFRTFIVCILLSTFSCAQQITATQEQSLPRTRGSELKEEVRSDLEAEVEKLEKQMKQLETLPSDIEQFAKVHIHVAFCSLYTFSSHYDSTVWYGTWTR